MNMKKSFLFYSLLMLALVPACFAGTSSVTATVQDPNGQVFANGTVTATFVPNPNASSATYTSAGLTFPQTVVGTLNGAGLFNIVVTDNNTINPALSKWNFTVCPNASSQCAQFIGTITGAAPNISAQINAITPVIAVQPSTFAMPFAYLDAEIVGPRVGTTYYNTTLGLARVFNGTIWASVGTSSAWASGGITAGVFCKSNGAGLCLDSNLTDNTTNITSAVQLILPAGSSGTPALSFGGNFLFYAPAANTLRGISGGGDRLQMGAQGIEVNSGLAAPSEGFCFAATIGTCDSPMRSDAISSIVLGKVASGAPASWNFQVGATGSGANIAGGSGTIRGGNGTGSGGGGSLIFQTGVPHGADSVLDTFTTAMTIDKNQLVTANVSFTSPHIAATTDFTLPSGAVQTGTQGTTGTKLFSCTGAFTSGNVVKTDANGNCVDGGAATSDLVILDKQDPAAGVNGNSADQTVYTYSMPSTTLAANKCLRITFFYLRTVGAGTPNFKLFFGGTTLIANAAPSAATLKEYATVCNNTGSTTAQWGEGEAFDNNGVWNSTTTSPAENTSSGSIVIKGTFNVAAGTSVAGKGWIVELLP